MMLKFDLSRYFTTRAEGFMSIFFQWQKLYWFLCEVKNAQDLALKMKEMLVLSDDQRRLMGENGRLKMENEFDENIVIQKYLQAIDLALLGQPVP